MDGTPRRPSSLPVPAPESLRKVSDRDKLRALSRVDAPELEPTTTTNNHASTSTVPIGGGGNLQTPNAAARRRSMKERTPRQVQQVLDERKMLMSAKRVLKGNTEDANKQQTPMALLRAMSRLPDLPPPTPDPHAEEPSESHSQSHSTSGSQSHSLRRGSTLSRPFQDPSLSHSQRSSSQPDRELSSPAPGSVISERGRNRISGLGSPEFRRRRETFELMASGGSQGSQGSQGGGRLSTRFSMGSIGGGVGTPLGSVLASSEHLFSPAGSVTSTAANSVFTAARERFSYPTDPEPAFDVSQSQAHSRSPSPASENSDEEVERSILGNRSSVIPEPIATGLQNDEGQQREESEELQEDSMVDYGDFGGGDSGDETIMENEEEADVQEDEEEEEDGVRIPWEEKGKGVERDDQVEEPAFDDEEVEMDEDEVEDVEISETEANNALPRAPTLTKHEISLKRKSKAVPTTTKRIKIQRYTPDGQALPDLPKAKVKMLFQHFLGGGKKGAFKVDNEGFEAIMDASQEFFRQLMEDASAFSKHAGRKNLINESDLVLLLYRAKILDEKCNLQTLGRKMGLDREMQMIVDSLGTDGRGKKGGGAKKRKRRVAREGRKGKMEESSDESAEDE